VHIRGDRQQGAGNKEQARKSRQQGAGKKEQATRSRQYKRGETGRQDKGSRQEGAAYLPVYGANNQRDGGQAHDGWGDGLQARGETIGYLYQHS